MNRSTGLVVALVLLGGAGIMITRLMLDNYALRVDIANVKSHQSAAASIPKPAPAAAAVVPAASASGGREVIESARQMMIDALAQEGGSEKKLWMRVDPKDREASTFANQIATVFRDQGWEVSVLDNEGMRFKAGLLMLVGPEDDPPSYVVNAQAAIDAIGQDVTKARGYSAYYESQKRDHPDWQGTKFLPDQTYVLLVGRKPEAKPAE
ncbi:MAG TPA: hypothetical protein VGK20_01605 [Candidatus Binatia bacterium]|jgi:hypothetical protein